MSDSLNQDSQDSGFSRLLETLVATHTTLQQQAERSVDTALVARNWLFGWYIVEFEQGNAARSVQYGKQLIARLSEGLAQRDLRGVSVTNLNQCRAFYLAYQKIRQTVSGESFSIPNAQALAERFVLGWSHYVVLLTTPTEQERRFYEIEAHENSWGVRELKHQISTSLFERLALSRNKDEVKALAQVGQLVAKPARSASPLMTITFTPIWSSTTASYAAM